MPHLSAAWHDGRLATGPVDAVVTRVTDRTETLFTAQEADLVPALVPLTVGDTDTAMRRWAAYADALVEAPLRAPSARTVQLTAGVDGWGELAGRLDPAGAHVVNAALDAATTPDGDAEPARSRGQRRADALVAVARCHRDRQPQRRRKTKRPELLDLLR